MKTCVRRVSSFNFMNMYVNTRRILVRIVRTVPCKIKSFRRARRDARLVNCKISQITRRASLQSGPGYKLQSWNKAKKLSFSYDALNTFKNEKEFKGGIITCTQRAGILVGRKMVVCFLFCFVCLFVLLQLCPIWLLAWSTHRAEKDAFKEKIILCTVWELLNPYIRYPDSADLLD